LDLLRVPKADWADAPVDALARGYDVVDSHSWYSNLDPVVAALCDAIEDGTLLVDYSGGTGILEGRLLPRLGSKRFLVVIVDASAKFLRLALEKFHAEPRVAFRHLPFSRERGHIVPLHDVAPELRGRTDIVVCTNAMHLYPDFAEVARSWFAILKPGGRVLAQSGNVVAADDHGLIIDETVRHLQGTVAKIVEQDARFAEYRPVLADAGRMARHDQVRKRYFPPPRPLATYLASLRDAGFVAVTSRRVPVRAGVSDWYDFLSVYHEGVLSWIGGTAAIEGAPASAKAIADRLDLIRMGLAALFPGQASFQAVWTYVDAQKPEGEV
jgi:SAM-dependent methyltransferase